MDYNKYILLAKGLMFFGFTILSFSTLSAQSEIEINKITSTYNTTNLKSLILDFEEEFKISSVRKTQMAQSSDIELMKKEEDGLITELNDFGTDGTPLYYSTLGQLNAKTSTNLLYKDALLDLNLDGSDMQVGIWDAGIALTTHQEFDNRAINADSNTSELGSHATLVTGVIISSGIRENAKGIASNATALSHDWRRDKIEVAEAAANGLLLSNHSYGISSSSVPDWYFGSYIKISQDWDKIMYNAPYYLMVSAAGNSQNRKDNATPIYGAAKDGFDLQTGFNTSKNGLVIAGADIALNNKGELLNASVSSYSSFGPIDDSRIKPDLAGNGSSTYSTFSNNNQSYNSAIGTSMAAPGVTGSLLLLQEYYNELNGSFMKAATLKGLALHTAKDVQKQGPDYKMGWGVLNTKKAADAIVNNDYTTLISEKSLIQGETYSITVKANGEEPLLASISWTDPEGQYINRGDLNNPTAALINDLDIRITKDGNTHFPWKMSAANANANAVKGDNRVDPFERIDIFEAKGEYTITITHKGTLTNKVQDFSLIVSGIMLTDCKLEAPKGIHLSNADKSGTLWSWNAINETLYEVQFKEKTAADWNSELTWESNVLLSKLEIDKTYQIRMRSYCSENLSSEFGKTIEFIFDGVATQIKEENLVANEMDIKVYPNPAISEIRIERQTSLDAVYLISTTAGNIIRKGVVNDKINVSSLKSGLYIITVQDDLGQKSTKFFKN